MTSVSLFQVCFISACSNALLLRNAHPLNINKAVVGANRRSTVLGRHRHPRRHNSYSSSLATPHRRRRTASFVYWPGSLQKASHSFASTARPNIKPRRRKESARRPQQMLGLHSSLEEAMLAPAPAQAPSIAHCGRRAHDDSDTDQPRISEPTPPPLDDDSVVETRSMRSESVASRSSNRLSLTIPIPIALPTAPSSRPTPTSSNMASYPPTPLDTPALMSPVDPNDFITAIAAQERRVLELREELTRAESELNQLKKRWTSHEAHKKHAQIRNVEAMRPLVPHVDTPDDQITRRSIELDRRKALLLGQQSQQSTPTHQYRRRVFRGGHTRTLSLLSPTKPSTEGFAVHEDSTRAEHWKPATRQTDSPSGSGYTTIYPTPLSKRASWAPRSAHQQSSGVKQIAEDLKTGLWTFMEDLRQATVGDEPITGQGAYLRGIDGNMRSAARDGDGNQDTIRASTSSVRPHASSLFEYADETPTPVSRFVDIEDEDDKEKENSERPGASRQNSSTSQKIAALSKNAKRFSWTPLTIDSYDDNDWSNWESPTVKSPRWSGSTMNGDIITEGVTEAGGESNNAKPPSPKKKASASRLRNQSPTTPSKKLEELLPPVLVNHLSPSNLKKTASNFMKEWEKSLSPPPQEAGGS
ncbi:hypothetical protein CONLIGDRAFT_353754 [Coniochaeta ligniaria NRRL 30616]|uniref:DUF4048 domain-containing protein n=1 Tax=Coniochaeta ligniaria NRRL 30616 TaxID=1408157 RepID=A0A1J7IRJ9_9PEZI|nr:hypothetical protein CONLIGDRAFT_353754 [Coniochaeta ligniaria NRRL 30616]